MHVQVRACIDATEKDITKFRNAMQAAKKFVASWHETSVFPLHCSCYIPDKNNRVWRPSDHECGLGKAKPAAKASATPSWAPTLWDLMIMSWGNAVGILRHVACRYFPSGRDNMAMSWEISCALGTNIIIKLHTTDASWLPSPIR